jgi:hypothetical protein
MLTEKQIETAALVEAHSQLQSFHYWFNVKPIDLFQLGYLCGFKRAIEEQMIEDLQSSRKEGVK